MRKLALIYCLLLCAALSYNLGVHTAKAAVPVAFDSIVNNKPSGFDERVGYLSPYSMTEAEISIGIWGHLYCKYLYSGTSTAASRLYNHLSQSLYTPSDGLSSIPYTPSGVPYYTWVNCSGPTRISSTSVSFWCDIDFSQEFSVMVPSSIYSFADYYRLATTFAAGMQTFTFGAYTYACELIEVSTSASNCNAAYNLQFSNFSPAQQFAIELRIGVGSEDIFGTSWGSTYLLLSANGVDLTTVSDPLNHAFSLVTLSDAVILTSLGFSSYSNLLQQPSSWADYGFRYIIHLQGYNIYPDSNVTLITGVGSTAPDYQNCDWYDIPCHLGNALLYFLYVFPVTKGLFSLINGAYTFITETFGFIALWSGVGIAFAVVMTFIILRIIRYFTS